jgi:hypothetical protein
MTLSFYVDEEQELPFLLLGQLRRLSCNERLNQFFLIRELTSGQLRIHQFAIDFEFKAATPRGHQFEVFHFVA